MDKDKDIKIENALYEINKALYEAYADAVLDKSMLMHAVILQRYLDFLNSLFLTEYPKVPSNLDLGQHSEKAVALGYRLYRMLDYISIVIRKSDQ